MNFFLGPISRGVPISSVVVRCFTEALPENRYRLFISLCNWSVSVYIFHTRLFSTPRLSRLLHKHLFEEAEKFAIAFELDLEASLFLSVF